MGKISAGKRKIQIENLQKLGEILMSVIAVMPAAGLMISLGKVFQMTGSGGNMLEMAGNLPTDEEMAEMATWYGED